MRKIRRFVAAAIVLGFATGAQAQATRTWVSGVGDDVNPCSRTAPCKTFAGAISKTAAHGEIDTIDAGGFGAVTITKSITIDGRAQMGSVLATLGVNGVTVNAGVNDIVILRNLSINGAGSGGSGVRFIAGGSLILENVQIFGFTKQGVLFEPSGASRLVIAGSSISDNVENGVLVQPNGGSTRATLSDLKLLRNGFAGLRLFSGGTSGSAVLERSVVSGNNKGIAAQCNSVACEISVERTSIFDNVTGITTTGAPSVVRLSDVGVYGNTTGISVSGGTVLSFGNNHIAGNTTDGAPTATAAPK